MAAYSGVCASRARLSMSCMTGLRPRCPAILSSMQAISVASSRSGTSLVGQGGRPTASGEF